MSEVNSPVTTPVAIKCVDAIQARLTPEEFRGWLLGTAFHHVSERHKGGEVSITNAVWFLERLVALCDALAGKPKSNQPLDPNRVPTDEDAFTRPWVMGWDGDNQADNPEGPEQLVCVRGDDEYPFVTTRTAWRFCRFATDAEIAGLADAS